MASRWRACPPSGGLRRSYAFRVRTLTTEAECPHLPQQDKVFGSSPTQEGKMQECDWTGTAAAVTALALTAGVWLWPADHAPAPTAATVAHHQMATDQAARDD